jgi:hypothetical protein
MPPDSIGLAHATFSKIPAYCVGSISSNHPLLIAAAMDCRRHAERRHVDRLRRAGLVVGQVVTLIMPIDEPRPRGVFIGRQVTGPRLTEAEHYFRCDKCGGWFDARDLGWVEVTRAAAAPGARWGAVVSNAIGFITRKTAPARGDARGRKFCAALEKWHGLIMSIVHPSSDLSEPDDGLVSKNY